MQIEPSLSTELAIRILIGFSVGAIMGIERQKAWKNKSVIRILGIRSFGLLSLLGTFTAIIAYLVPHITLVVFIVGSLFAIIIIGGYTWYKFSEPLHPFGWSFLRVLRTISIAWTGYSRFTFGCVSQITPEG